MFETFSPRKGLTVELSMIPADVNQCLLPQRDLIASNQQKDTTIAMDARKKKKTIILNKQKRLERPRRTHQAKIGY